MPDFPSAPKEPPGVQATPYVSQSVPVAQPAVHVAQPPPHYHVSNPSTSQTSASLQQAFNIARTVAKGTWRVGKAIADVSREHAETARQQQQQQRHAVQARGGIGHYQQPPQIVYTQAPQQMPQPAYSYRSEAIDDNTCWLGVDECPEQQCGQPLRITAKVLLTPPAVACYGLGLATWLLTRATEAICTPCMCWYDCMKTQQAGERIIHAHLSGQHPQQTAQMIQAEHARAHSRINVYRACSKQIDEIDRFNGDIWLCEIPTDKRLLTGHMLEAPCQLYLWRARR